MVRIENGKIIEFLKNNRKAHYIMILLIALIISIELIDFTWFFSHDGRFHLARLMGTLEGMAEGQFPPLIVSKYANGCGYGMNIFYPVLTVYVPMIIKIFTSTFLNAEKIFAVLMTFISGISMYELTKEITNKKCVALISSLIYMFFPYKLVNVYVKFAVGEFSALAFIPYVFLGLYNLIYKDGKKHFYITIGAIRSYFIAYNKFFIHSNIFSNTNIV